jgi:hypothetical protein
MNNAYCEKCGGRWLPRCPGESYGSCPWCEIRELHQQLAAAEARAERLEALYREARRAHCYSLTIDHNVREKWESEFNVATDAAIRAAKEETK